ncbi:hypothetical protein PG989_007616 [Apiospora arundinis]
MAYQLTDLAQGITPIATKDDIARTLASGQPAVIVDASIWAMFSVSTLFMALRFYCRVVRSGKLLLDDYVLTAGWICMFTSAALLTKLMSLGVVFAVHTLLLWRPFYGFVTRHDLPVSCWDATRAVVLNIFSSLYSSLADFTLAFLPWKVLMDLQMIRPEKLSLAIGMSFGVMAGITGIVKAARSATTLDFAALDFQYNLISFWIFTLAEPNATLIAACVPVLRVLFKDVKKRKYGSDFPSSGRYVQPNKYNSTGSADKVLGRDECVCTPTERGTHHDGITRTQEIAVDFDEDGSFEMRYHLRIRK